MKLFVILIVIFALVLSECLFRVFYKRFKGRPYHVSIRFSKNEDPIVHHPYLSFAMRRNCLIEKNQKIPYDLHPYEYWSFKKPVRLNNFGHLGSDFTKEKKENTIRIVCLGDCTTFNNLGDGKSDHSYPAMLEKKINEILTQSEGLRCEVFNCGIPGWLSTDILINYELNILPLSPDYIVLIHGFTDLHLYLTESFSYDYSHGRCNLGYKIKDINRAKCIPKIRFLHLYEYMTDKLFGSGNLRNEVIDAVRIAKYDLSREYHDLKVEKNILKNILILSQYYDIKCVLCTYPFYAYKNDFQTEKLSQGVEIENQHMKELAEEFDAMFCDLNGHIPKTDEYFFDWVHVTPKGMDFFADRLSIVILEDLFQNIIHHSNKVLPCKPNNTPQSEANGKE